MKYQAGCTSQGKALCFHNFIPSLLIGGRGHLRMWCGVEFMEGYKTENLRSKEKHLFKEEGRGVPLISCALGH